MEKSIEEGDENSFSRSDDDMDNESIDQDENDSNENRDDTSSQANNNIPGVERKHISKKRRRTKNDQSGRDFKCGCGKTYLSYPALYTHIKEKHQGSIPDGSSKPASNTKGNRGRPRKTDENGNEPKNELLSIPEIFKLEPEFQGVNINPITDFPTDIVKDETFYKAILSDINLILTTGKTKNDEPKNETNGMKTTCCNKILAFFILDKMKDLDVPAYQELCIFACFYRKALNEKGYEAVNNLFKEWKSPNPIVNTGEFCEKNNGFYILEVCNDLIEKNLKTYITECIENPNQLRILNDIDLNFHNVVQLFLTFALWLKKNGFTNSRLTLN